MVNALLGKPVLLSAGVGLLLVAGLSAGSAGSGAAAPSTRPASREATAKILLAHQRDRFATPALTRALRLTAGLQQSPGRLEPGADAGASAARASSGAAPVAAPPRAGLANIRVNDPAADRNQIDQTTQSETSVAVSGSNVAVGFNDSQRALLALTSGFDFSGYSYSTDGGTTFTDGGVLPNKPSFVNFGDPWLTADRTGRMYYATLSYGGDVGNLEVGVATSDDGGKTWSEPTLASPNDSKTLYFGDKEAIAAGRDPKVAGRDNLYLAWDDFVVASDGEFFTGLPVSTSGDGGTTWKITYADKVVADVDSCSFAQYIGAQPIVDPANGTLYVAAEKIVVDDPDCTFTVDPTFSEVVYTSTDGGGTFDKGVTVSPVVPAAPDGVLRLNPGQVIRTIEFPTLAIRNGTLWLAWNDGATGRSHIQLASSADGAKTWKISTASRSDGDEIQPALSVDAKGLHLAYYQRNLDNTLDVVLSDSTDGGSHFRTARVTNRSFPGVQNLPQFDPQIAFGYMGDYISNVSDGTNLHLAWGDNRNRVTDFMWPQGRNDPDVYFARR